VEEGYLGRLGARMESTRSVLCVGIDPDPTALPAGFPPDLTGVERFARILLASAIESASAVKVNLAFFEAWGSRGLAALERLRAAVPARLPFIADAKRGDIGSTAAQHARALFDRLDADAITVSPYLGADAIEPLLDRADRFVYVLCRTSNPGAGALQALEVAADPETGAPEEPLAVRVARLAPGWQRHPGTLGLVVGATAPAELERIRAVAPGVPFLVPGIGHQGGDERSALAHGPAREPPGAALPGGALLVNISRAIAAAGLGVRDVEASIAEAVASWSVRLKC
jgi:orotidine-5'-phosphate decarboxylase